jgi:ketosteroid isomerase-like protein
VPEAPVDKDGKAPAAKHDFEERPAIRAAGDAAWVAAEWSSEATGPDGQPFRRPGRGTFVLARRDGRWLCVDSHVSLLPSQSENARGRL